MSLEIVIPEIQNLIQQEKIASQNGNTKECSDISVKMVKNV